jgi:tetratricopeptide (TPR) repeat protein
MPGVKLKEWKLRRWVGLAAGILLLAVTVGFVGLMPRGGELPGWICGSELALGLYKSSAFKQEDATHFLVARFQGDASSETDFSAVVSTQMERAQDIEVPTDPLEIRRVACVIKTHEQAETIARVLNADVVIWGQADATVHPKATLYQTQRSINRGGENPMDLASLGQLDLPALRSMEPLLLVQFALGLHFYEQEKYWLAARFIQKSAELAQPQERGTANIHLVLGLALLHQHDAGRSLQHSRLALETVSGSGSVLESTLLNNIGSALEDQGDYAGALENYRRALAITEKALGPEHPAVAARLSNIGSALNSQGDSAGALEQYRRALAITEKALGPGHPDVATWLLNIGGVLDSQGDSAGALENYRRALAITEKALGPEHPLVAIRLNIIGGVLSSQGDYAGALEQYRRALAITEKALGPEHPAVATLLENMGGMLNAQGDYAGALAQYRRALAMTEKAVGPEHPDVAIWLNTLGGVLSSQGDYAGALVQYRRALAISEKALGKDHPTTQAIRSNLEAVQSQ